MKQLITILMTLIILVAVSCGGGTGDAGGEEQKGRDMSLTPDTQVSRAISRTM